MLRPRYPDPVYTVTTVPASAPVSAPMVPPAPACACQHHAPAAHTAPVQYAPAPRPSIAPYVAGGIAAVGGVAVIGVIAIGLLLAFAVSALSIAVVAVVLRTLLTPPQQNRR
jgi:type IV secretory pathway VirB2 component (pilin)